MPNCGYLYTFGNAKHAQICMEKLSTLPKNQLDYTLKVITSYFQISKEISDNANTIKSKIYLLKLVFEEHIVRVNKYLVEKDQQTYVRNVMRARYRNMIKGE